MAWTTPLTATANSALTASQWNASVRDNLNETGPAKASAAGQIFVATGANSIVARTPSVVSITTSETTTSTAFDDLATVGPSVTVTTGTSALVMIVSRLANSASGVASRVGYTVSGATTVAANNDLSLTLTTAATGQSVHIGATFLHTGLTAGSNTFKMVYKVDTSGTGTFSARRMQVVPL